MKVLPPILPFSILPLTMFVGGIVFFAVGLTLDSRDNCRLILTGTIIGAIFMVLGFILFCLVASEESEEYDDIIKKMNQAEKEKNDD